MYYVHGEPLRRFNKKFTALIATLAILMNGIGASLPFMLFGQADAATNYTNGFEVNTDNWTTFPGTITRVSSGTDGITSSSGSYHAKIDGGVFTNWGGYENNFPINGYTTQFDIYIDTSVADGTSKRIDFSSAINNNAGAHLRDFVTHIGTVEGSPGTWSFGASNNAESVIGLANGHVASGKQFATVSSSGWYTVSQKFYNSGGFLNADFTVSPVGGSAIGSKTISNTDAIATVGGHRYGWFIQTTAPLLTPVVIDNAVLVTIPVPTVDPCTSISTINTTDLSTWYLGETRTFGSNEIVNNGLRAVTTPDGGTNSQSKAAGYYPANFDLEDAGIPNIEFASYSGVRPSLQLGVDKDNDGDWDGYLVYEPWAYGDGNFWSSKDFGISSGLGYTSFGTLNQYLAANQNAKVISIGYSLGSGVVGDAVITKLTAGCVDYTFLLPPPPSTTVVVTGNTAAGENQPGWLFNRDPGYDTPYAFDAAQYSIGTGSLHILPIGANPNDKMIAENFLLTPMSDIHSIKYDFKIGAGGDSTDNSQFYMNIYANYGSSSPTKFYDCRYDVVAVTGSTSNFTTMIFDPTQSYPVVTRSGSPACPASPATMGTGATIRMFSLNVGDTSASDTGLDGYLDNVVVRTTSAITVYDFEPFVNNAPVVNFANPTPAEGSVVSGVITPRVLATDDYGMGSYYIRLWKGAFESGLTNLVSNNCSSAPGAFLLGTNLDITCPAIDTSTLTDGTYVLSAQFLDGHIVWGQALRTFTIDKTAPTVPSNLLWTPNGGSVMGSGGVTNVELGTLNWDNSDTDVDRYKYYFWTDIPGYFEGQVNAWSTEGTEYIVESPTGGSIWTDFADKEGTYYFCIKAIDAVGNSSACSDTFSVTYDDTAPAIPTLVSPANAVPVNGANLVNDWQDVAGASYYIYTSYNVDSNGNCILSPIRFTTNYTESNTNTRNVTDLTFCWEVQAVDAAGNISSPSTRWKTIVDNTAPTIPTSLFAEDPSGDLVSSGGITNSQNFAFTLGSSTDTTRYQLKYWNDIIGSPYKELTPWNPSDLSGYSPVLGTYKDNFTQGDGVHYFSFSACDNAGNCSSYSSPFRVTYDNTAPTVTIIDSSTSGNVITPDVSATDASPLTYLWSTAPGVTISNTSAQEPSFTVDVDGTYNFTLTATDTAGNSVIVPFSFTYTTPPAPAPTPTVLGATTSTTPPAPTTAFTNVTTTNNNNETQEVPVTEADQEENTSGEVEGATTNSNFANTADDAVKTAAVVNTNNFLGLGWWWLAIIAAIAGLLWFLLGKDKEENEA